MEIQLDLINPQIKKLTIGIRKLRDISIYPLSVRDQLKLSEIIVGGIKEFYGTDDDKSDAAIGAWLMGMVEKNMDKILGFIVDKTEIGELDLFSEMSNDQLVSLVDIIYDVNYGSISKKVKDLLAKVKGQFLSRRSSAQSSETVLNTDSKTSSDDLIEKEE